MRKKLKITEMKRNNPLEHLGCVILSVLLLLLISTLLVLSSGRVG